MTEKVIQANSGTYGRVQVTLLMPVKEEILSWAKEMGINKAAFLRMALMIGASTLVEQIILTNKIIDSNKTKFHQSGNRNRREEYRISGIVENEVME